MHGSVSKKLDICPFQGAGDSRFNLLCSQGCPSIGAKYIRVISELGLRPCPKKGLGTACIAIVPQIDVDERYADGTEFACATLLGARSRKVVRNSLSVRQSSLTRSRSRYGGSWMSPLIQYAVPPSRLTTSGA